MNALLRSRVVRPKEIERDDGFARARSTLHHDDGFVALVFLRAAHHRERFPAHYSGGRFEQIARCALFPESARSIIGGLSPAPR